MKIKIIKDTGIHQTNACTNFSKDQVLNVEDEMAKDLVDKGIAEYVLD